MPVEVRVARTEDYAAVADLTATVYLGEGFTPASAERALRDIDVRAKETLLFCAVDAGRTVGAVSVVPAGSTFRQIGRPDELEMRLLAVDGAARGAGVGELLVRAVVDEARAQGLGVVLSTQPLDGGGAAALRTNGLPSRTRPGLGRLHGARDARL